MQTNDPKVVTFVSNLRGAGKTTITAAIAAEAAWADFGSVGLIDRAAPGELTQWRDAATGKPEEGDLSGIQIFDALEWSVDTETMYCREMAMELALVDAGSGDDEKIREAVAAADFVVVLLTPEDEGGLAGEGAEAVVRAHGVPGGLLLNKAAEGEPATLRALEALAQEANRLPLIGTVPQSPVMGNVLSCGVHPIEADEHDQGTKAVLQLWHTLQAMMPDLAPPEPAPTSRITWRPTSASFRRAGARFVAMARL